MGMVRRHHDGVQWCKMAEHRTASDSPKPNSGSVRVSVSFDAQDYAEIKNIAGANRVSAAWVVREAVTRYLDSRTPLFPKDR